VADRDGEGARQAELADNELGRQLATLAYASVGPSGPDEAATAATWWNVLARLGLTPPLAVVHDLGLLLTRGRQGTPRQVRRASGAGAGPVFERYEALLAAVASSDALDDLQAAPLADETVGVILASLLSDVNLRWPGRPRVSFVGALPLVSPAFARERPELARAHDPAWAVPFLQRLVELERGVLARLEQLHAGTLRLLGLFQIDAGGGAGVGVGVNLADLVQLVTTAGVADVVDFSLELLPSLLETKRRPSAQRFSIDGYASVERRGNPDALLPGELAHDDEVFELKALSDDLLHYGHERRPDAARRLHYILVDASASMRGAREVFARGLALALAKTFSLRGGDVWVRFFDSRLHDRLDVGRAPRRELPRFLTFRSERGRNYARVFGDLAVEIARLRRESPREIALTFISHAECHVPLPTIEALARDATLYGIFVLPSGPLELDYLSRLHRHQVVTAESLARAAEKRRRALEIVEDAALD
jgi:hypothetical protein